MRGKTAGGERVRMTVVVPKELFERVENARFMRRDQTRSATVEALLQAGLKAEQETGR
ncbi:hypothetical protein [Oricola indica]|uniref:hypothetical protein n=1 Tax=Oricola indica TaxID=2872591 RepID=UPI001CBF1FE2|nr:hypothetical protein [Oricola indica]